MHTEDITATEIEVEAKSQTSAETGKEIENNCKYSAETLEELALLKAIRDTFVPGLSTSNADIFASFMADISQYADTVGVIDDYIVPSETSDSSKTDMTSLKPAELQKPLEGSRYFTSACMKFFPVFTVVFLVKSLNLIISVYFTY